MFGEVSRWEEGEGFVDTFPNQDKGESEEVPREGCELWIRAFTLDTLSIAGCGWIFENEGFGLGELLLLFSSGMVWKYLDESIKTPYLISVLWYRKYVRRE